MKTLNKELWRLGEGFTIGVMLSIILSGWGQFPVTPKIALVVLFTWFLFSVARSEKYAYDSNHRTNNYTANALIAEPRYKSNDSADNCHAQRDPSHAFLPVKICIRVYRIFRRPSTKMQKNLGLEIADTHDNECGYRTAIGRVYYACHLIGSDATKQKGWFSPKNSAADHRGLCKALKERNQWSIEDKLRDLLELREHADYHIKKPSTGGCKYCKNVVDKQVWERAKSIASDILPKLEAIYPQQHKSI